LFSPSTPGSPQIGFQIDFLALLFQPFGFQLSFRIDFLTLVFQTLGFQLYFSIKPALVFAAHSFSRFTLLTEQFKF